MADAAEQNDRLSCTGLFVRSRATIADTMQRLASEAEAIVQRLKSDPPPSSDSIDDEHDEHEPIALLPEHTGH